MKKTILSLILVSTLSTLLIANADAEQKSYSANAQWDATAKKDSKSQLVIVPMSALSFNYAAGTKRFNTADSSFSIDIMNDGVEAADFMLSAKTNDDDNILTRLDRTDTKLIVGAKWNNKELGSETAVTLLKAGDTDLSNTLKTLLVKNDSGRSSAEGKLTFFIKSAKDGKNDEVKFNELPDGEWNGKATVNFTVAWTE